MQRVWLVIFSSVVVSSAKPLARKQALLESLGKFATIDPHGDTELEDLDFDGSDMRNEQDLDGSGTHEEDGGEYITSSSDGTTPRCLHDGRWPAPKKMDLVITWWTNASQSAQELLRTGPGDSEQGETHTSIENQAEIKYLLRSYEKYGLLDHIGTVFILMDQEVRDKFGPPRFFDYKRKDIKIVTDHDVGVDNTGCFTCGKWAKWLGFHLIPDIADYFLFVPDDAFMLNQFNMAAFYDEEQEKPIIHGYGTWSWGECNGGEAVGSGHGPLFVNKCAWESVAETYRDLGFKGGNMLERNNTPIDAICLYSNAMKSSMLFKDDGTSSDFYYECHTNAGAHSKHSHIDSIPKSVMFANIQGPGVSDEYDTGPEGRAALDFFHKMYPSPSRFELPQYA